MAKEKDPAFLFYSKDWIQGTAEYSAIEKGVMIDLMAHMHQEGSIPLEFEKIARLARLSLAEFLPIWDVISEKWEPIGIPNGDRTVYRMVNRKLSKVMTERSDKGHKNTIVGTFASLLRPLKLDAKTYKSVKSLFKIEDFIELPTERITERLTEWLTFALKSIENGNANGNEDIINNKGIVKGKNFVAPSLQDFKDYFVENDFSEDLAERAWKGYDAAGWKDSQGTAIKSWKQKCQHVWFQDKNRTQITGQASGRVETLLSVNEQAKKQMREQNIQDDE